MTSLFIYIVHGTNMGLKLSLKATLNSPDVISLGVHYRTNESLSITGSPIIIEWLQTKATWFRTSSRAKPIDQLALLKQLFDKLVDKYSFTSDQIYLNAEGNLGAEGAGVLSRINLEFMNYMNPAIVILPTGTPECCKFIHYWRDAHGYPPLQIEDKFFQEEKYDRSVDFYSDAELTPTKIAELNDLVANMSLMCPPPRITTFDKKLNVSCAKYFLHRMSPPVGFGLTIVNPNTETPASADLEANQENYFGSLYQRSGSPDTTFSAVFSGSNTTRDNTSSASNSHEHSPEILLSGCVSRVNSRDFTFSNTVVSESYHSPNEDSLDRNFSGENLFSQFGAEKGTMKQSVEHVLPGISEISLFRSPSGHSYREWSSTSYSNQPPISQQSQNNKTNQKVTATAAVKPKKSSSFWCCSGSPDAVIPMKPHSQNDAQDLDLDSVERSTKRMVETGR